MITFVNSVGEGANVAGQKESLDRSAARERGKGFHNVADKSLKVVAKQAADFDRAKGLSVMESILQANSDIKAVFAHNDEMALGALEALKSAGKTDVVVVGFDATEEDAVKAVNDWAYGCNSRSKTRINRREGDANSKRDNTR